MLQKIVLTIDAEENSRATEVARSISALDTVNFMSAAWNNVSADTIQNCFFCSLTSAVPDEPFLGFPLEEVPALFTQVTYAQYVNLDDNLEITGLQDDANICKEVLQNKQAENDTTNEENFADATTVISPKNKEVLHALEIIRQ